MTPQEPRVFTIAPDRPFLEVLAKAVLGGFPRTDGAPPDALALARWTILLPTRRAARELEDIFFRRTGGKGLLLPKIKPIGDIDEDLLGGDDPLTDDLAGSPPPAISRPGQLLLLIDLIDEWAAQNPQTRLAAEIASAPHQAHGLAVSLAQFLDGLETEDIDQSLIPGLYDLENARHREAILEFLNIARQAYPARLNAMGRIGPQQRRSAILRREAARLSTSPPDAPFIAAGSTGTIPATRALLAAIARLPNGAVVLPGLDLRLDEESWTAAGPTHPQFAMKQLLAALGIARPEVHEMAGGAPGPRSWLAGEMMRPAETAHHWRDTLSGHDGTIADAMAGVELVETRNQQEQASAIALILRQSLETQGLTACLVTPDRQLARRVKAELTRWNIAIDDSAGEPLIGAGGAALINLLLEALLQDFSSAALCALLRHVMATFGAAPDRARRAASIIDLALLRGGTGAPDIAALPHALRLASSDTANGHLLTRAITAEEWDSAIIHATRIAEVLDPLRRDKPDTLERHLDRLVAACMAMAGERLWEGEPGALLAEAVALLKVESAHLKTCGLQRAAVIIRHLLQGLPLRQQQQGVNPLAILGLLEARLMRPGLVVLAGLNEGVWPASPDPGPWLNRPMRDILAMSQPERGIGQTAHDFVQAFGCSQVKLVWPRRSGDAPVTPSRWILRLQMILKAAGRKELSGAVSPWQGLARRLAEPGAVTPAAKPRPRPPVALRPRQLSVTRIETLIRDPYAIYARYVLKLQPLDAVANDPDPARRGMIFHGAIGDFMNAYPLALPATAAAELIAAGARHFAPLSDFPALTSFWWPRFLRIAAWISAQEPELRQGVARVIAEVAGATRFEIGAEPFTLTCRADRIDLLTTGEARIIDYKTGTPPSKTQVEAGLAPQLTLQAAILAAGGFPGIGARTARALTYIKLSGGEPAGEIKTVALGPEITALANAHLAGLKTLLAAYALQPQAYLPRAVVMREDDVGDYDHLSRYREWALSDGKP